MQVTEHEVQNSVRSIPKLDTLILVKVRPDVKEQNFPIIFKSNTIL